MAANECAYFPEMHPSKWDFKDFLPCTTPATDDNNISFWSILLNVQLESFLWGFGTAIGELPPYFMAKAAAEAGKSNEEIEELRELEAEKPTGMVNKIKAYLYTHLKKHGFITVLICASVFYLFNFQIPNPLFDLAGITCGHFGIPFSTFFGATSIGKSIIKVHIQAIFVILSFSKHHVENVLNFIENKIPFLHGTLSKNLENQKKKLWFKSDDKQVEEVFIFNYQGKNIIALGWEIIITIMIVYFLYSIINSICNDRRVIQFFNHRKKNMMRKINITNFLKFLIFILFSYKNNNNKISKNLILLTINLIILLY